jgi:hypothetical protein
MPSPKATAAGEGLKGRYGDNMLDRILADNRLSGARDVGIGDSLV